MKKFFVFVLAGCALFNCAKAQQTRVLTADKNNDYGLIYTLPDTQLKVVVSVTETVKKTGPFYQYAKKYVGTNDVVTQDSHCWTIDGIEVTPVGTADSSVEYLMKLKPGSATTICVAPDNMLLAINAEPQDITDSSPEDVPMTVVEKTIGTEDYLQYMGEEYLASQSLAKRAQYLSESMLEIREARNSLTRGSSDVQVVDGRQLELMLKNMNEQEAAMRAAFMGSVTRRKGKFTYYWTPRSEGKEILFRMSDFAGPVDIDDYSGSPVEISLKLTDIPALPLDSKGEEKKMPKDAVVYTIPARGEVEIVHQGKRLYRNPDIRFGQFGIEFGLDPALFTDKKDPAYVIFDPTTGALEKKGSVTELSRETK